jgi:hypothetical protein
VQVNLSATELTTFAGSKGDHAPDGAGCQRKWAYRYVLGIKPPQAKSAALGQEVQDEQLDPYLNSGRPFDYTKKSGEIALALTPIIPKPGQVRTRVDVSFQLNGDYGYWGEVDVWAPDSGVVPGLIRDGGPSGVPLVGDVKTTSDLKWALTDEGLKTDVQAILYAANELIVRRAPAVDLVWWYVRTTKPHRVQRAHARVDEAEVAAAFDRVDALGRTVARRRALAPHPDTLPFNVRTCSAYGGCPYRHLCSVSNDPAAVSAGLNPSKDTTNMSNQPSFLSNYIAGGTAPAAPPPPASPPYGGGLPPLAPGSKAWFVQEAVTEGHLPAAAVARQGADACFTTLEMLAPAGWFAAKRASIAPPAPAPAINPPESALPPAPPVGAAASTQAAPATRGPGRPPKSTTAAPATLDVFKDVAALAALMKASGVKRIVCSETQITEMELA